MWLQKKEKRQRTGRKTENNEFHQSTISFVKNERKNSFYLVDSKAKIHEKTFLEAAKIFSANLDEKRESIHDKHHDQVKLAIDKFNEDQNIKILHVPGSFELVYGCNSLIDKGYDAIIAIGRVIRGETKHFDFICNATSNGIKDLNLLGKCPIIFCVLTDENIQQSIDRSGGKFGNKGVEAAIAAIEMALI